MPTGQSVMSIGWERLAGAYRAKCNVHWMGEVSWCLPGKV